MIKIIIVVFLVKNVKGGCSWYNPEWLTSLNSAPYVQVDEKRIVSVSWGSQQFEENFDCSDKFDVGIRNKKLERRVCSLDFEENKVNYTCKLDLSDEKHCGQKFGFWVTAINNKHSRGLQRIRSFADTEIQIRCDGPSQSAQVKSSSCFAVTPVWRSGPFIEQRKDNQLGISWDKRQLDSHHCIQSFSLKFWKSGTFNPNYNTLKFPLVDGQKRFGGKMNVEQCKSYTYILSAISDTGDNTEWKGDFSIPCAGEPFLSPIGELYKSKLEAEIAVSGSKSETDEKTGRQNSSRALDADQESETGFYFPASNGAGVESKEVQRNTKTEIDQDEVSKVENTVNAVISNEAEDGRTNEPEFQEEKIDVELEAGINTGAGQMDVESIDKFGNNFDTTRSTSDVSQQRGRSLDEDSEREIEPWTQNQNKLKPPSLTPVNSTADSLTWRLEGLDPKIRIDKYQIACWEDEVRDVEGEPNLPCCKVEEIPLWEGAEFSTLTVGDLKPNTSYSCQGGMLVKGRWMFSPKALKFTENSSVAMFNHLPLILMALLIVLFLSPVK